MRLTVFFVLILKLSSAQTLQDYYSKARELYQQKDFDGFYINISKANEMHPYHQGIMYQKAIAAAHTNRLDESVAFLKKAILISTTFDLGIDDFTPLKEREDYKALLALQTSLKNPIANSTTAFTLHDRQLHVESIATGIKPGDFILTSIHKRKIIQVDDKGNVADFTTTGQDGLAAVMSIKIDKKNKWFWATSSPIPEMTGYDSTIQSMVYLYDLKTKKLLNRYIPNHNAKDFFFGDLIINKAGDVFTSDSKNNIIFKVNKASQSLEPFYTSDQFWNIQGITFSDDERFLFIADYIKGIFRLDMLTNDLIFLESPDNISLKGTDGLLFFKNSLITIQNGVAPNRVTRVFLNESLNGISAYQVIDHAHPAFNEPTNGCIIGNELYYIANSQWGGYDETHKIKPPDQLQDIIILKAKLK